MAAVCMNTFVGLRAAPAARPVAVSTVRSVKPVSLAPRASVEKSVKTALVASTAALLLSGSAVAAEIIAGPGGGNLVFVPKDLTVKAGETVTWVVKGDPSHNITFDEVPDGVEFGSLDSPELTAIGSTHSVKLTTPGEYSYICTPHSGSMYGTITVQ